MALLRSIGVARSCPEILRGCLRQRVPGRPNKGNTSAVRSLCVDARWIYSGIGTYTLNLLKELSRRKELELHGITLAEHKAALEPFCVSLRVVDVPIYSVREQFAIMRAARTFPVLHVPHYNAPLPRSGTLLVTIHDLTHILDARFRNTL